MNDLKLLSREELEELVREKLRQKHEEWLDRGLVYIDKYGITLRPRNFLPEYNIDKAGIKTSQDITRWIAHLSDKEWFTPQMLADFIYAAQKFVDFYSGKSKKQY